MQILRQFPIKSRPDPKFQFGGQGSKAPDKHLGVNGAKTIRQIGIEPVTIENSQSHLLFLYRVRPRQSLTGGGKRLGHEHAPARHFMVGMENSAPLRRLWGQRAVTVFIRV